MASTVRSATSNPEPAEATDDGTEPLAAHVHLGREQHALLTLILAVVVAISAIGYRADQQVSRDARALNDQLQLVAGDAVSLQRQVLTHGLVTKRWVEGSADDDQYITSAALVERQLRIFGDEATTDPQLGWLIRELGSDLDRLHSAQAVGRPAPGSEQAVEIDLLIDETTQAAKRFFDIVERRNFELIDALEARTRASRVTEVVVGMLVALLVAALVWSMRRMLKTNYQSAMESLRWEQQRYAEARADQHRVERQLAQAQKLESVGQLAAGIAHEINTPMQYIGDNTNFLKAAVTRLLDMATAAELAAADGSGAEELDQLRSVVAGAKLPMLAERAPKAATDALSGVEEVSRIVAAMKRFSHPGSEEFEPVDVNQAITTTMTVCRNEWKYAADIFTDLDQQLPLIDGRLGPLNQVLLNMIINAGHAVAERHHDSKGLITITTGLDDDGTSIRIIIDDNGAGIAPEHLDRVFDQFFTTKEVGRGTGQGLAFCHQVIVEEHHGTILVDSESGRGATFTIILPISQRQEGSAAAPVAADPDLRVGV